jgi:hypothetical protein
LRNADVFAVHILGGPEKINPKLNSVLDVKVQTGTKKEQIYED